MVLIKNGIKGNKEKEWWQLVFDHFPQFPQGVKYSYDELTFREDVVSVHLEYLTPSLQTPNPEPQTLSTTFHTISPSLSLSLSHTHTHTLSLFLPLTQLFAKSQAHPNCSHGGWTLRLHNPQALPSLPTLSPPKTHNPLCSLGSPPQHNQKNQKKNLLDCLCDLGGPKTKYPVGES